MVRHIPGYLIRDKLKRKGIKVSDVAYYMGVHDSTVTRYFNNDIRMTADFLLRLAKFAEIDVNEFLDWGETKAQKELRINGKPIRPEKSELNELLKEMIQRIEVLEREVELLRHRRFR